MLMLTTIAALCLSSVPIVIGVVMLYDTHYDTHAVSDQLLASAVMLLGIAAATLSIISLALGA